MACVAHTFQPVAQTACLHRDRLAAEDKERRDAQRARQETWDAAAAAAGARAIRRMRHPRGREDYKLRARTVEPVFGQLKTCQRLTTMSRRGLAACQSEWLLACTAHNLRKLRRHRQQG